MPHIVPALHPHPNVICIQNCGCTSRGLVDDRHPSAAVAPPDASLECRVRAHRPARLLNRWGYPRAPRMGRLRGERAESDGGSDAATSVRIVNEDVPLAGR